MKRLSHKSALKTKMCGQITLEASIIMPIVILIIVSLIYFSFYVHDVITIRSTAYSAGVQNASEDTGIFSRNIKEKIARAPLFVTRFSVKCIDKSSFYEIKMSGSNNSNINWLDKIINVGGSEQTMKIEKDMSREVLYVYSAVASELLNDKE